MCVSTPRKYLSSWFFLVICKRTQCGLNHTVYTFAISSSVVPKASEYHESCCGIVVMLLSNSSIVTLSIKENLSFDKTDLPPQWTQAVSRLVSSSKKLNHRNWIEVGFWYSAFALVSFPFKAILESLERTVEKKILILHHINPGYICCKKWFLLFTWWEHFLWHTATVTLNHRLGHLWSKITLFELIFCPLKMLARPCSLHCSILGVIH